MRYQPNPVFNQEQSNRNIVQVAYQLGAVGIFTPFIPILTVRGLLRFSERKAVV
jgi:uncharacterized membrane protein